MINTWPAVILWLAPVVKEGMLTREVYFPAGADWLDWWTGERFQGGKPKTVSGPLDRLPLYVRVGARDTTEPVIQYTGEMASVPITLTVAGGLLPGAVETSRIFQDAGDGYGDRADAWREIKVTHRPGR